MAVSNNIKRIRKLNNLYQKELADKVGTSSQVISNWERGYTKPNDEDLISLADALNCSVDELLGREPKHNNSSDDFDAFMFEDKEAFDSLPDDVKKELIREINEKIEFLKYKQNKDK